MVLLRPEMRNAVLRPLRAAGRLELAALVALSVAVVLVAALYEPSSARPEDLSASAASHERPDAQPQPAQPEAAGQPSADPTVEPPASSGAAPATEAAGEEAVADSRIAPDDDAETPAQDDPLGPALPSRLDRYQVQRGETLASIASAERTSVDELVAWNEHLDADSVLIRGEWLWIPRWESPAFSDQAASGIEADEGTRGRGGG